MPSVVGDFNQKYLSRLQTLRNNQKVAQPTQELDATSIMSKDIPTVRNADGNPNDLNTTYAEAVSYIIP